MPLVAEWLSLGRAHAGGLLVPNSIRHEAFGTLVSSIHNSLTGSTQADWPNRVAWVLRA